jgi:sec-independent protein translocase protein TatB
VLDFGWAELLIIVAVAVFVIGPKDIPNIMYGLGRLFRRFQYIRFAISKQFDDILEAGDIEELRRGVNFEEKRNEENVKQEKDDDQSAA